MKKFIMLLTLVVGLCFVLGGCFSDGGESSESQSAKDVTYTVTFKQSGELDVIKKVKEGESLKDVPSPKEKVGYTVEWDKTSFTNVKENIVVNAIATANKYTVTYDANGGSVASATQEVTYDTEATLLEPEREDYYFLGWSYDGVSVVSGAKWTIADDVTLVASWQDRRPEYTVTFIDGSFSSIVTVKKGESVAEADVPELIGKVGHTASWDKTDYSNVTENMTVTAIYTPITYTVTYSAEGFEVDGQTIHLTYGEACTGLAVLTSETQNFIGWVYNGNTYTAESVWNVAEEDAVLTASWADKDQIVVTFVDTDGTTKTRTLYVGQTLDDVPTPSAKVGYNVDSENWYTDSTCTQVASLENLQSSITVYAKAEAKTYTVTYNVNGGIQVEETIVTFDKEYVLATPTHSLEYMEFVAWKDDEGNAVAMEGVWTTDGDWSLIAEWRDSRAIYTVTFEQPGEQTLTYTVKAGEAFTDIPAVVEKKGYTVTWDEAAIAKLASVNEDIKVSAVINPKTCTVTLNLNGGYLEEVTVVVTYGEAYELPTPAHGTMTFDGWTYNGNSFDAQGVWELDEDEIQLVAKWKREWTNNY